MPADRSRRWRCVLGAVLLLAAGALCALNLLSRGAAVMFNQAMSQQGVLRGTVTATRLSATPFGAVSFEGLAWTDENGEPLLSVPSGSFEVRLWDVIRRELSASTVEAVTLNGATISVRLDRERPLDIVRPSPTAVALSAATDDGAWRQSFRPPTVNAESDPRQRLFREWKNFDSSGKRLRYRLTLNDCRLEVFRGDRHYLLNHVRLAADIDSERVTTIDLNTGTFGGTMIGDGMSLKGSIDFDARPEPTCDLAVRLDKVDPSSLGLGMKVNDQMTLAVRFTGTLRDSVGEGAVSMDTLHIPAMTFSKVSGNVRLEDARLSFTNVSAGVYGGSLLASGEYDLNTRRYHINGHGTGLRTSEAFPHKRFFCKVDMDLEVDCQGDARSTLVGGTFASGKGKYLVVPFNRLSGRFTNRYHDLRFYDVTLEFPGFTLETDAFSIINGKLHLGELRLRDVASD